MPDPIKTTSFLAPLMLREDLPRQTASDYWAGPHGEIVKRGLRGVVEYVQHHFSATDRGFYRLERAVGRFQRQMTMPEGIDPDGVSADFDRGVLSVRIPKPEQVKPRRVAIGKGANGDRTTVEGTATDKQ